MMGYCHYTTKDRCFNFLDTKCFEKFSLTAICGFTFFGTIIWGVLLYHEVTESGTFTCYEVGKKTASDAIRDGCYDDYNKQFNQKFPLHNFTLLVLSLVLGVCVVYSQYVRPQVENEINSTESRDPVIRYKVFTVYSAHLIIKSILMTVALVLQWGVLYPTSFPETFSCYSGRTGNNSTENPVNNFSTTINLDYHCKNPPAGIKTILAIVLFAITALFLWLSLVELIYLLPKAKTENFTNNQNFCRKYLNCIDNREEETSAVRPLLNMEDNQTSLTQRTQAFQETVVITEEE